MVNRNSGELSGRGCVLIVEGVLFIVVRGVVLLVEGAHFLLLQMLNRHYIAININTSYYEWYCKLGNFEINNKKGILW